MMHLLRKNDVAPLRAAMMRCLPQCAVRHTSLGAAVIIGKANIICRRQTSFPKTKSTARAVLLFLEAPPGFEPGDKGFADPCLTAWLWRRYSSSEWGREAFLVPYNSDHRCSVNLNEKRARYTCPCMERITGLEPATSTLARWRSTK